MWSWSVASSTLIIILQLYIIVNIVAAEREQNNWTHSKEACLDNTQFLTDSGFMKKLVTCSIIW
jgi:hypothetical protein